MMPSITATAPSRERPRGSFLSGDFAVKYKFTRGTAVGHYEPPVAVREIARIAFLETHATVVDVQAVGGPVFYISLHASRDDLRRLCHKVAEYLPAGMTARFINLSEEDTSDVLI